MSADTPTTRSEDSTADRLPRPILHIHRFEVVGQISAERPVAAPGHGDFTSGKHGEDSVASGSFDRWRDLVLMDQRVNKLDRFQGLRIIQIRFPPIGGEHGGAIGVKPWLQTKIEEGESKSEIF